MFQSLKVEEDNNNNNNYNKTQLKDNWVGRVPLIHGSINYFVLFRPLADWMRLAHIKESI
jgi:hypothetical protein